MSETRGESRALDSTDGGNLRPGSGNLRRTRRKFAHFGATVAYPVYPFSRADRTKRT